MSVLNHCLFNGAIDTAKTLLENGFDINEKNYIYPISAAIASENPKVVEFAINNGAIVNIDLGNGWTPLHEAIDAAIDGMIQNNEEAPTRDSLEIIALLIQNGADAERVNDQGKSPLDLFNVYCTSEERLNALKAMFKGYIPSIG